MHVPFRHCKPGEQVIDALHPEPPQSVVVIRIYQPAIVNAKTIPYPILFDISDNNWWMCRSPDIRRLPHKHSDSKSTNTRRMYNLLQHTQWPQTSMLGPQNKARLFDDTWFNGLNCWAFVVIKLADLKINLFVVFTLVLEHFRRTVSFLSTYRGWLDWKTVVIYMSKTIVRHCWSSISSAVPGWTPFTHIAFSIWLETVDSFAKQIS